MRNLGAVSVVLAVFCSAVFAEPAKLTPADGKKAEAYKEAWAYLLSATINLQSNLSHLQCHSGWGSFQKPLSRLGNVEEPKDMQSAVRLVNACKGVYAVRRMVEKSKHPGCELFTEGGAWVEWSKAYDDFLKTRCDISNAKHWRYVNGDFEIVDSLQKSAQQKAQDGGEQADAPKDSLNTICGIKLGGLFTVSGVSNLRGDDYQNNYRMRAWLNGRPYWENSIEVSRPFRTFRRATVSATMKLRKIYCVEFSSRFPVDLPLYEKAKEFEETRDVLAKKLRMPPSEKSDSYETTSSGSDIAVFDLKGTYVELRYTSSSLNLKVVDKALEKADSEDREAARVERRKSSKKVWQDQKTDNKAREDLELN